MRRSLIIAALLWGDNYRCQSRRCPPGWSGDTRAFVKMLITPCVPFCVSFYGAYVMYRRVAATPGVTWQGSALDVVQTGGLYADISYSAALVPVRDDFAAAHTRFWKRLSSPGAVDWRRARRHRGRSAASPALCALPGTTGGSHTAAVEGEHDHHGTLPAAAVEVIHRVVTDPGRLSRKWCRIPWPLVCPQSSTLRSSAHS